MEDKQLGIVSYLTLIGWIVAVVTRKEKTEYTSFHLRQMAGLMLLSFALSFLGFFISRVSLSLGTLWSLVQLIPIALWVLALIGALNGEMKKIPVLGDKFQQWFAEYF